MPDPGDLGHRSRGTGWEDPNTEDTGGHRCRSRCPTSTGPNGSRPKRWLDAHCGPEVPRSLLDADEEKLLPVWGAMADQGWLGIHLPEDLGGQGFGLFELAVLLEETGWSVFPGPLLPRRRRRR